MPKAPRGTGRYPIYPPQAEIFWVFPRDGTGKGSRLLTAGWEWDGKVGSHLVDGTGSEYTISWRDGIVERVGNGSGTRSGT